MNHSQPKSVREIEFFLQASKAYPSNVDIQLKASTILSKFLPHWHIPMVHDHARNDFYEGMIKREVKNKAVLDIGTGTGFLALLAAKYGAKHVYACEMNPLFYCIARQNILRSPYKNKISLFFGPSKKLKIGRELPVKVDLLVSEIISTGIFSEGMLATLRNAKRLMKADGRFLPRKIEVYANLIRLKSSQEEYSHREIFDSLIDYGKRVPSISNIRSDEIEVLSDSQLLTTVTDGFVLSEQFPIRFRLKQKIKTSDSRLCVYFKICDGEDYVSNFDFGNSPKHFANSWGLMSWPVSNQKTREFELHLGSDQRLVLI